MVFTRAGRDGLILGTPIKEEECDNDPVQRILSRLLLCQLSDDMQALMEGDMAFSGLSAFSLVKRSILMYCLTLLFCPHRCR